MPCQGRCHGGRPQLRCCLAGVANVAKGCSCGPASGRGPPPRAGGTSHAAEGDLPRACSALVDPPPLPPTQAVLDELQSKHPPAEPADLASLTAARPGAVPEFDGNAVSQAIRSFKPGSAPGPTGLRADHLREALLTAHGDEVVLRLLARGEAPASLAPHLAGGTLHALPKPAGGVRPIAVGEVLRRLVGKLLCQSVREAARDHLWPCQLGVGVPAGTEAAVHAARQWLHRNAGHVDKVLLKLDFRNAFNAIDRTAMLREARAHLPEVACWADWCYGSPSRLLFGEHVMQSCCAGRPAGTRALCAYLATSSHGSRCFHLP